MNLIVTLLLYVAIASAVLAGFAALCVVLGFGYTLVAATFKRDWRDRSWTDWNDLATRGLPVWIAGWFTLLPIYYLGVGVLGNLRLNAYANQILGDPVQPGYWVRVVGAAVVLPAIYAAILAGVAWCTWTIFRLTIMSRSDYGGHFGAWALFGYLGLPILIAVLGISPERGVLP
jgi:hypothetical protein